MLHHRPAVLAASVLSRLGLIDAVAVWPDERAPTVALDLRDRTTDSWARTSLPDWVRRLPVGARTWQGIRSRAMVLPHGDSPVLLAAERALGRPLRRPRVSLLSPGGGVAKLTLFVGEAGRRVPTLVVQAMAHPESAPWLAAETEHEEMLHAELTERLRAALLPLPLWAGAIASEYFVVHGYEPALSVPLATPPRVVAHAWLREFHLATAGPARTWTPADTSAGVSWVEDAWREFHPASAGEIAARVTDSLRALEGRAMPHCAAHGDFWPGNLAELRGELKVFDWEWYEPDRSPCLDLWAYELGELNQLVAMGHPDGVAGRLERAAQTVRAELSERGLDPAFALPQLPIVLAELMMRVPRRYGRHGPWDGSGDTLLCAVEELLGREEAARPTAGSVG